MSCWCTTRGVSGTGPCARGHQPCARGVSGSARLVSHTPHSVWLGRVEAWTVRDVCSGRQRATGGPGGFWVVVGTRDTGHGTREHCSSPLTDGAVRLYYRRLCVQAAATSATGSDTAPVRTPLTSRRWRPEP
jgi:hypothetical protein